LEHVFVFCPWLFYGGSSVGPRKKLAIQRQYKGGQQVRSALMWSQNLWMWMMFDTALSQRLGTVTSLSWRPAMNFRLHAHRYTVHTWTWWTGRCTPPPTLQREWGVWSHVHPAIWVLRGSAPCPASMAYACACAASRVKASALSSCSTVLYWTLPAHLAKVKPNLHAGSPGCKITKASERRCCDSESLGHWWSIGGRTLGNCSTYRLGLDYSPPHLRCVLDSKFTKKYIHTIKLMSSEVAKEMEASGSFVVEKKIRKWWFLSLQQMNLRLPFLLQLLRT
jgi:hypothetical protein